MRETEAVVFNTLGRIWPPIEEPPDSIEQYFHNWLDRNGHPWWQFLDNVRTWWETRDLPNGSLLHFQSLKDNMPGIIRDIAKFLEAPINKDKWAKILPHCDFDYMKYNATRSVL
ncbi:MAG: sulfotransferase domain-containing protein [Alphaproteobacteria bacterium]|nr:sulfotransferase domain-containing protein [Alphaproteobacteria bacterium]